MTIRDGSIVTSNLADYAVPVNADIPEIEVLFVDKPDPYIDDQGIGARGIGEITVTGVAAAVASSCISRNRNARSGPTDHSG